MARSVPRTRLEQLAQEANLSVLDFVKGYKAAAGDCGEGTADVSHAQVKRWLSGMSGRPRDPSRARSSELVRSPRTVSAPSASWPD